jgi:protease-4
VWTGRQAREIKLVDRLGGLDQAIALAKEHAKIPRDQEVEIVTYPPRRSLYELLAAQFSGNDEAARIGTWLGIRDRRALGIVASPLSLFRRGEPLALMPFALLR